MSPMRLSPRRHSNRASTLGCARNGSGQWLTGVGMEGFEQTLGAGTLLSIAAGAIALLLVLIIRFNIHAFIALVLVSLLTALVAGIPTAAIVQTLTAAFGSTLGGVALLVALGAMLGRLLEISGGAESLANALVAKFGEKRAPLALGIA